MRRLRPETGRRVVDKPDEHHQPSSRTPIVLPAFAVCVALPSLLVSGPQRGRRPKGEPLWALRRRAAPSEPPFREGLLGTRCPGSGLYDFTSHDVSSPPLLFSSFGTASLPRRPAEQRARRVSPPPTRLTTPKNTCYIHPHTQGERGRVWSSHEGRPAAATTEQRGFGLDHIRASGEAFSPLFLLFPIPPGIPNMTSPRL